MAKKQTPTAQDYHKSETYKNADTETRRNLHRYKSELNITDEQMNWLMALEDVRLTPKEQRRKGNATAEMMVIGAMVTFLLAANVGQRAFMLIASVFFITRTMSSIVVLLRTSSSNHLKPTKFWAESVSPAL